MTDRYDHTPSAKTLTKYDAVSNDCAFLVYLENRRRQLIAELRDVERHLLNAGRISKSALKPARNDK